MAILAVLSIFLCYISNKLKYSFISMPYTDISQYHLNILTINSIFCGFALTNLGILLSITDDQLVKKLEGTDILQKRNIVMAHSIIFGSISIFISMFWVLKINFNFFTYFLGNKLEVIKEFLFYMEIFTLIFSILYFILSIKKMIELLSLIHVPKRRYTDEQIEEMRKKILKK